ncbi:MAG TPA: MOSC N-terminal beta barrel domain-containing protein [Candidatus Limnocylindrales bacterium]|nr:MOSC N-terminal beta barrel domain-containing protein [Candidatus Limnocylindrales bacterium]
MLDPVPASPAAGVVTRISIAPVKGLGLVFPDAVQVARTGVVGDRRFAMLDRDGRLANGKRLGPLVRIRPEVTTDPDGTETLLLHLPDGSVVGGPVVLGDPVDAVFYGAERPARPVLGPYDEVLSGAAGQPLRLVRMTADGHGLDRVDDGAVTLLSQGALEAMAAAAGLDAPVDARRFRMTFTIAGVPAHAEDAWLRRPVRIGEALVRPMGNVGRCAVTTQDPDTGIRSLDTLKLIAETRGHLPATEPLPFGVHAEVVRPGRVAVGDAVRTGETLAPEPA